eukprot:4108329-Pleurochrysis_carterae.AAC.1
MRSHQRMRGSLYPSFFTIEWSILRLLLPQDANGETSARCAAPSLLKMLQTPGACARSRLGFGALATRVFQARVVRARAQALHVRMHANERVRTRLSSARTDVATGFACRHACGAC